MGRATRWFRGLLGGKSTAVPDPRPGKEKSRWGFFKSFREREKGQQQHRQPQPQPPPPLGGEMAPPAARVSEERKGSYRETGDPLPFAGGDERSKHAIAVAAATAAVADAAVAAAHAAAAVVRLTSSGRCVTRFRGANREWAAVKIQAAFRGYLARRALKALKGLVKLQALVRGNIVRKQAAETLRCMHALVRVQARARACRALRSERSRPNTGSLNGPQTPEKYELAARSSASRTDGPCTLKRNPSKSASTDVAISNREQSSGWNWLDQWMEERYWDGRGAPAMAGIGAAVDDEKNAKILEIDTGRPQLNQKRRSNHRHSSCSTLASDQNNSRSFTTAPDSPSKDSTTAQQSASSPSSVDMQQSPGPLRFPVIDLCESPQFYSASSSRPGSSRRGPFTPSKSECARSLFGGYPDYPNYMANTESSKAKVRSQSAPKQRPEFEKSRSLKRLSAAHGSGRQPPVVAPSAQRPSLLHSKFANKAYPGSGRLDRLGMPIRI